MSLNKWIVSGAMALSVSSGFALSNGCTLVEGDLHSLSKEANGSMLIETGQRAILEWPEFSIESDQSVTFNQQDATSWVLNRVTGPLPSTLNGSLTSNGHVVLVNPQGVMVGETGVIESRGFIASTADIPNSSLLSGGTLEFTGDSKRAVVNLGKITAHQGDVFLIARRVENNGTIQAPEGVVGLASGSKVLISPDGGGRVMICPSQDEGSVENCGFIKALTVELRSSSPYALAVKNSGSIEAGDVAHKDGRVYLVGSGGGTLHDGHIKTHGNGEVHILGEQVHLGASARVDVSNDQDGGHVLIGGDYRGLNQSVMNAKETLIDDGALICADSLRDGDGGLVVVWSDEQTRFNGEILARGSGDEGHGGFAEVSSGYAVSYKGAVDLSSSMGHYGDFLLDPKFVYVDSDGTDSASGNTFAANPANAVTISGTDLAAAITSANVTLEANTDVIINDTVEVTSGSNGLTLSSGRSTTLTSEADITLNGGSFTVTINDEGAISSDRDSGNAQFKTFKGSSVATGGGNITVSLGSFGSETKGQIQLGGGILNAAGGNISIEGVGYDMGRIQCGVRSVGETVTTSSSGTITINGTSGNSAMGNNCGVYLSGNGTITAENGAINIVGVSTGTGSSNQGLRLENAHTIKTTGSGDLTVNGTGGPGTKYNMGIMITGRGSLIEVTDGDMTLTGVGQGTDQSNQGIHVEVGGVVKSVGTAASAGSITLHGTGSSSSAKNNCGVLFSGADSCILSTDGDISVTGLGGGDGSSTSNQGVRLESGGLIRSIGSDANAATITVNGTAGNGTDFNMGVIVTGSGSTIYSDNGDITVTGIAGGIGNTNQGVRLEGQSSIKGEANSAITVTGTGANGESFNNGVCLSGKLAVITADNGNVDVTGTGQGSGRANEGVSLTYPNSISTTGSGSVTITSNDS